MCSCTRATFLIFRAKPFLFCLLPKPDEFREGVARLFSRVDEGPIETMARRDLGWNSDPLSSMPSAESWGIGEFSDAPRVAEWLQRAGLSVLPLLPLNETAKTEFSPYSPLTAMALDPQFISLRDVADFAAIGGDGSLDPAICRRLTHARSADRVDYSCVRTVKEYALRRAFERFLDVEWRASSPRAQALERYIADESWWIEDYALFRAIRSTERERECRAWPDHLRRADPGALAAARITLEREVLFYQYLQWIAGAQWQAARRASRPVSIFGDFPFLVTDDSADVWTSGRVPARCDGWRAT